MDQITRAFLERIRAYGGAAKLCQLPSRDKAQDNARKKARRAGWASYGKGKWAITAAGVSALKSSGAPSEGNSA